MRGSQSKKLRDIGAYEGVRTLQQELDAVATAATTAAAAATAMAASGAAGQATTYSALGLTDLVVGSAQPHGHQAGAAAWGAGMPAAALCMTAYSRLQVQSLLPTPVVPQAFTSLHPGRPLAAGRPGATGGNSATGAGSMPMPVPEPISAWTPLPREALPQAPQPPPATQGTAGAQPTAANVQSGTAAATAAAAIAAAAHADGGLLRHTGSSCELLAAAVGPLQPRKRLKYQAA